LRGTDGHPSLHRGADGAGCCGHRIRRDARWHRRSCRAHDQGQSKFGAELDSLADFVNFGVAPGLILYFWQLNELHNVGWIAAMVFAISGGLRLARFNATMDDPNKPVFAGSFFTGVPAPAGAITVLLPIYLAF